MFSAATPARKGAHTRASAAVRRSQSRAGSLVAQTPPPVASTSSSGLLGGSRGGPATATRRNPRQAAGRKREIQQQEVTLGNADGEVEELVDEYAGADTADSLENMGVLLKTDSHSVSLYGTQLPVEVQQILSTSDFYTHPANAVLDDEAGYATFITRENCYVWSTAKATTTFSPTCYAFPVPEPPTLSLSATIFSPVPFTSLVYSVPAHSAAREPGFLLVCTTGQVCFWSSITAALSDVSNRALAELSLAPGEVVRALHRLNSTRYLAATSGARLFSLRITDALSASSAAIQISQLSRSRGMLARVGGFFGSASADPRAGISTLTSAEVAEGREKRVYAVSDRVVQSWRIQNNGQEQFMAEHDLYEPVLEALVAQLGVEASTTLQPEIIDAKASCAGTLTLLVAHWADTARPDRGSARTAKQLAYALVTLEDTQITLVKPLSYRQDPDPRPLSSPRLYLPKSTERHQLTFVLFPDLVIITTTSTALPFEESVSLRDSGRDRLLGGGIQGPATLNLLAASSGLLQLDVNLNVVLTKTGPTMQLDAESLATQTLKSKLDQAVIFGERAQNPLAFDLKLGNEGDLVSAAERVSKELLAGTSPHLPNIIDLRAQLNDRAARLRFLITFIQDNSLISRLSKTSRRHLCWDAEKVQCAIGLWHAQNVRLGQPASQGAPEESLLVQAIEALDLPTPRGDDRVRGFFRVQLDKLGLVLEQLLPILQHRLSVFDELSLRTDTVYQVVQALCTSFKAVSRFRLEAANLYGITDGSHTCLTAPWSSRPRMLELFRTAFEQLEKLLADRTRELGTNVDDEDSIEYGDSALQRGGRNVDSEEKERQKQLKQYMAELADFALAMHQERMAHLQSLGDDPVAVAELRPLLDGYVQLRSHTIQALVRISRTNVAYDLAERYRDFRSLVLLCNDPSVGSPMRVQFYIEKYKEDFAFSLYSWYLEQDRLDDLMKQDTVYWDLLSKFLEKSGVKRLSWLQDVATQRYEMASKALLEVAAKETQLAEQKLMLSIGKLSKVANMTRSELQASEQAQRALEAIDDRLDIVAAHAKLLDTCREALDARDLSQPAEEQARRCRERLCTTLDGPSTSLVQNLLNRLLTGSVLSTEDLIDLYTLKDNASESSLADYSNALDILIRDKHTPRARLQLALGSIWRRVYLRDDWTALRQSAGTLSDEAIASSLQSTALFSTLFAIVNRETPIDSTLVLRPTQAFYSSSADEETALRTRFSSSKAYDGLSMDPIIDEYERESRELKVLVDGDHTKLEEFYDEVERLVAVEKDRQGADTNILPEMEGDETMDIA